MSARPEPREPARYFAWLYSPAPLQVLLSTLFAIEHEVRAGLRPGVEHRVAHVRLEWWREECQRLVRARPLHPLTRSLREQCAPAPDLSGLVGTALWDLAHATFASREELTGYLATWATAVTLPAARCGIPGSGPLEPTREGEAAARFGRALGVAVREAEMLAELRQEARAGRLRLPLDELEQAAVEPGALGQALWPQSLARLVGQRCRAVRGALAGAAGALPAALQPPLRGLLVWGTLAARDCRLIEAALPGSPPAGILSRFGAAGRAWRAARAAQRRRFVLAGELPD